ncbi:DNA ligase 4 [Sphaceloma murrayae]|uniref:DNA ligase n=1 Tax=Sphaceloma murrayae TaxID=2082308 RepID=A0A2K1QT80_9PEZI|nr:DNA ligase 4 [Sphaceloma murrayae]
MSDHGDGDVTMVDEPDEHTQSSATIEDMDANYPNRPKNHSVTLPFHDLITLLFNPLLENRQKPKGPVVNRKKIGPHAQSSSPHEIRRSIIERFVSKWKNHVGHDIYPAFRLIMPDKDRDRAMYGLKEKTIGKLLIRVMKIGKDTEDASNLLNWKVPGTKTSMAGDFAGRCYEVLKKRPRITHFGDLTVGDVNDMLDQLSAAQREENQLPILEQFYRQMNPEELVWLIRMILRQMKIGATEKTILDVWHPNAEDLFNVSSSLRRVCWELHDQTITLDDHQSSLGLMQCFQPQLAAFQMHSLEKMVQRMKLSEENPVFWIEEKLDGERMQLHMIEDQSKPGGRRFGFWSRKAKDYAYLYGDGFEDPNGALTRYLKDAFDPGVRNIILDGEMITWDPAEEAWVPFGHLKTAALNEQRNPYANGTRPVFTVFDCLYLNDTVLTKYTLRDRYKALRRSVRSVERRIEIHTHTEATRAEQIEPILHKCVAERTEGLVLKNPTSPYRLNERNDDWMKVKPEYMTEFGEALDCIVVGGYYGSGHRGGKLSSFLCGLKISQNLLQGNKKIHPSTCYSFFKVGGGMTADDYREIRHLTDGKWKEWDPKKPPSIIILGGQGKQYERPDVWIYPEDSIVLEVKAASVHTTDQFGTGLTLRFPRFKRIRKDKDFQSALSSDEFRELQKRAEEVKEEKRFQIDDAKRKKRATKRTKRETIVAGQDTSVQAFAGPKTQIFEGRSFLILSEQVKPKKSKADLEGLVKANGGKIVQTDKDDNTIIISDRNVVKAAALKKAGKRTAVRPKWLLDCIAQAESDIGLGPYILPLEPGDVLFGPDEELRRFERNVDEFGDSYARDVTASGLLALLSNMGDVRADLEDQQELKTMLEAA